MNGEPNGNGERDENFLVVSRTDNGYRVFEARHPSKQYLVSANLDDPGCTCDAFAEDGACEHVRAVLAQTNGGAQGKHDERRAIEAGGQPAQKRKRRNAKADASALMTLKRSVSPDGRIDSLSVEFTCPVEQVSVSEIKTRSTGMLKLQADIVSAFLAGNGKQANGLAPNGTNGNGHRPAPNTNGGPVAATMLRVGSSNGKWGPRLFISLQANGQGLRRFGTAKQLVEVLSSAGYRYTERDIADGLRLDLPCLVVTKPSANGRYVDVDRVLPRNDGEAARRAR